MAFDYIINGKKLTLTRKINKRNITLIGSTSFKPEFMHYKNEFEKLGDTVYLPNVFSHYDDISITDEDLMAYKIASYMRISYSDFIFVINKNNYIGKDTKEEIKFAQENNIPVLYMEPISKIRLSKSHVDTMEDKQ